MVVLVTLESNRKRQTHLAGGLEKQSLSFNGHREIRVEHVDSVLSRRRPARVDPLAPSPSRESALTTTHGMLRTRPQAKGMVSQIARHYEVCIVYLCS